MKVTNTVWHWRWKAHLQTLNEVKEEAKYFPYIEELRAFDDFPKTRLDKKFMDWLNSPEPRGPEPKTKYTGIKMFLLDLVEEGKAEKLGSGAFRTVYQFNENPTVVLKYARGGYDEAMRMNKEDFEIGNIRELLDCCETTVSPPTILLFETTRTSSVEVSEILKDVISFDEPDVKFKSKNDNLYPSES